MEVLDILDQNGNKTGKVKPRKEVHSNEIGIKDFIYGLLTQRKNY